MILVTATMIKTTLLSWLLAYAVAVAVAVAAAATIVGVGFGIVVEVRLHFPWSDGGVLATELAAKHA